MLTNTAARITVFLVFGASSLTQLLACSQNQLAAMNDMTGPAPVSDVASPSEDMTAVLAPADMTVVKSVLTVMKTGSGTVSSKPSGIDCGITCAMNVDSGTKVSLTAVLNMPFTQSFWEGCPAWNDTCELTVNQPQKVSVTWGPEVRPKLVKVPKGTFLMGSPASELARGTDEVQHSVTLTTDFWMSETEVTQRQYRNLMGKSPSNFIGDDLPVEQVTWVDAAKYCNALSLKEKLRPCYKIGVLGVMWPDGVNCTGYRLPTEAEWEYAANPPTPPRTVYAGSDAVDGVAWYEANGMDKTHPVKTKTPNGRGLYDMSGNAMEWVWDVYQANYEALPATDPMGPQTNAERVVRGGSYFFAAELNRVSSRGYFSPGDYFPDTGFRIVRSSP